MIKMNKNNFNLVLRKVSHSQNKLAKAYSRHGWIRAITSPITVAGLVVLLLSVLNISGSSIGMYSHYFNQGEYDTGLILGTPNAIRSDEWLVNSQMLVSQKAIGYPYINKNIGNGQNMSLGLDVPYGEWSMIFKPQNLIFFIAPFSFAFAFKWWFVLFVLFCSSYVFALHFLPRKRLISSILAAVFSLSPFIQWWLTPQTVLILGFGFLIGLFMLKIHGLQTHKVKYKLWLSIALAYTMVCFALMLYPPFQIPCVIVIGLLYLSTLIRDRKNKNTWISLGYIAGAGLVALLTVGLFLLTRIDDVRSLLNTSYPGARVIESGGVSIVHTFSTFVAPLLQNTGQAMLYTNNQSESSNFVIPYITILLTSFVILVVDYKNNRKVNLPILAMLLIFFVFVARMTLPFGDPFYKLLFLSSTPNLRLFIGLGLTSFILLVLIIRYFIKEKIALSSNVRWAIVSLVSIAYSALIFAIIIRFPGFISSPVTAVLLLATMVIFAWLLVNKYIIWSLLLLLCFSIMSAIHIHPIYKGTDILTKNPISLFIANEHNKDTSARWALNENIQLENFAVMNGAPSLTGVYALPQVKLFKDLVPSVDANTINRYAHVQFNFDETITNPSITLLQADSFIVNISPCSVQLEKYNLKYIISTSIITSSCTTQIFDFATQQSDPTNILVYKIQR